MEALMERSEKKVSMMVVKRLPKYYQYLKDLQENGIETISSKALGELSGLTPSQIRQDLNAFGAYGIQGKGYDVDHLLNEIRSIMGLKKEYRCIIVGSGNMGRAMANYERFKAEGIHIIGLFDVSTDIVGKTFGDLTVRHIDDLEAFTADHAVDICILSVPRTVGQVMAQRVCGSGIKGILNFVPLDLNLPEDVSVENVNITDSMFTLTYLMGQEK